MKSRLLSLSLVLMLFSMAPAHAIEGKGGGPDKSGVNQYTPQGTQCYGGQYPESTCDKDRVEESIAFIVPNYVTALQLAAEQLAAGLVQKTQIIGAFFDAEIQMDAQRNLNRLKAEAHKDYHPGEQMCRFGTFMRSIAHVESRADMNKQALNWALTDRYVGKMGMASSANEGYAGDVRAQLELFKHVYCDPTDNNNSLSAFCEAKDDPTAEDRARYNRDIDFVRAVDLPLTLDVDFTDGALSDAEQDILTLARGLYWPKALDFLSADDLERHYAHYMSVRQNMAKHIIAHNSFITQVAMKSAGSDALGLLSGPAYMKAFMREFGLEDNKIDEIMGENPSYYAQMAILTKKIYQSPDFYTNLYDKPVNIDRINASLEAIQLMQGRDFYETQLRQEMLISQMID